MQLSDDQTKWGHLYVKTLREFGGMPAREACATFIEWVIPNATVDMWESDPVKAAADELDVGLCYANGVRHRHARNYAALRRIVASNVEVTGAAQPHRAASVLTAGLCPGDDNGE